VLERRGDEFWVTMLDPRWETQHQARRNALAAALRIGTIHAPGAAVPLVPPLAAETLAAALLPVADDAPRIDQRIVMTTGSHHMQEYWIQLGGGNTLCRVPLAYLADDDAWVGLDDIFLMPPRNAPDVRPWNQNCIHCHSVAGQPKPDPLFGEMRTQVAELGIACEACHGPAAEHVRVNHDPLRRYSQHAGDQPDTTIVHPARLDHVRASQVCGQCHGIPLEEPGQGIDGRTFRPGEDLNRVQPTVQVSTVPPEVLERWRTEQPDFLEIHFWSDGMVRVSGREYNGLVETPCFQRGTMSCLSCHSMHDSHPADQLAAGMGGDHACTQCHEAYRQPAAVAAHTHHDAASAGSRCYNCHMPHTTYGLLGAIRSHQVDSPSVQPSLEAGRPNACNLCHLDRTLDWTAAHLADWHGHARPELTDDQRQVAAAALWMLQGDAGQRALVAWSAGWGPAQQASGSDWLAPYLGQLLVDPYAAVRYIAARSLRSVAGYEDLAYDYVAPSAVRAAARRQALAAWEGAPGPRPELLIGADGRIDQPAFARLLGSRDDRPVVLQE
jgi:predicted CXXCH cytochrome family protein